MATVDEKRSLRVIGAPFSGGSDSRGVALGPAVLRIAGLAERLRSGGYEVDDVGDVLCVADQEVNCAGVKHSSRVAAVVRALSSEVYEAAKSGAVPMVLGGDHSIALGSVNGMARYCSGAGRELFVLWLDAHGDFNTPTISPTGNAHGMSAALSCGEDGAEALLGALSKSVVNPENMCIFGARWLDPAEQLLIAHRGVTVVTIRDIDRRGAWGCLGEFLDRVRACSGVLHLSFDVDSLDPLIAPGVSTPEVGGISVREAHIIMEQIADSGLIGSLDVVEVNPLLDVRNATSELVIELMATLFGRRILDGREVSPIRDSLLSVRYGS